MMFIVCKFYSLKVSSPLTVNWKRVFFWFIFNLFSSFLKSGSEVVWVLCVICYSYKWLSPLLCYWRVMYLRCLIKNLLQSTIWFLSSHYFNIMVNISCIATEQGVDRLFVTVTGLNQLSDQEKIPLADLRGAGSINMGTTINW